MNIRIVVTATSIALLIVLALFDVDIRPEFAWPAEQQIADPAQEQRFDECYARHDARIHEQAFGTIDNPDVQREFISMHRETAQQACREQFPEQMITVQLPLRVNLFDVRFRYGD
jgi:hypothetical protein